MEEDGGSKTLSQNYGFYQFFIVLRYFVSFNYAENDGNYETMVIEFQVLTVDRYSQRHGLLESSNRIGFKFLYGTYLSRSTRDLSN